MAQRKFSRVWLICVKMVKIIIWPMWNNKINELRTSVFDAFIVINVCSYMYMYMYVAMHPFLVYSTRRVAWHRPLSDHIHCSAEQHWEDTEFPQSGWSHVASRGSERWESLLSLSLSPLPLSSLSLPSLSPSLSPLSLLPPPPPHAGWSASQQGSGKKSCCAKSSN